MLSFSVLSPLLIGPKVNFFQIKVAHKAAKKCTHVGLDPRKRGPPNLISSKKATIGSNKIFLGYMNNACIQE
jgi:hypothetical protein